jgi:hypothetical protein
MVDSLGEVAAMMLFGEVGRASSDIEDASWTS